jgi:hypothetical protein
MTPKPQSKGTITQSQKKTKKTMDQFVVSYLYAVVISVEIRLLLATGPDGEEEGEETVHCVDWLQICRINGVTSEPTGQGAEQMIWERSITPKGQNIKEIHSREGRGGAGMVAPCRGCRERGTRNRGPRWCGPPFVVWVEDGDRGVGLARWFGVGEGLGVMRRRQGKARRRLATGALPLVACCDCPGSGRSPTPRRWGGMRSSTINFVGGRVQSVHLHRPLRIQRQQFHRAPILQATPQQVKRPISAQGTARVKSPPLHLLPRALQPKPEVAAS